MELFVSHRDALRGTHHPVLPQNSSDGSVLIPSHTWIAFIHSSGITMARMTGVDVVSMVRRSQVSIDYLNDKRASFARKNALLDSMMSLYMLATNFPLLTSRLASRTPFARFPFTRNSSQSNFSWITRTRGFGL